jgi:hypothetical protein
VAFEVRARQGLYKIEQTLEPADTYFREIVDKGSGRRQSGGEESAIPALRPLRLCCSSCTARRRAVLTRVRPFFRRK